MPPMICTNCGYVSDMAAAIDEEKAKPKPGDATICIECGHLMVFNDDLSTRDLSGDEIKTFSGDERIVAAMTALGLAKADTEKKLDPNIIYPGKDPDFVFPEEME